MRKEEFKNEKVLTNWQPIIKEKQYFSQDKLEIKYHYLR